MTKLKPSSRNLARAVFSFLLISSLISGCAPTSTPAYKKEEIPDIIKDICKKEYKLDVVAKMVGSTLWVYLPLEDLFVPNDKPQKYQEKFLIEQNKSEIDDQIIKLDYLIKPIPEEEKTQEYKYNKKEAEKINNVWSVIRRVIFSMEKTKTGEPEFLCVIAADIKNGFEIKEVVYTIDLKKISYGFISVEEYQHRMIQDTSMDILILGDKEGRHVDYKDMTLEEFVLAQIQYRVRLKFQKPEVQKNADIDKEIAKIIAYTVKTYNFKDFDEAQLHNLLTKNRIILNRNAVFTTPTE